MVPLGKRNERQRRPRLYDPPSRVLPGAGRFQLPARAARAAAADPGHLGRTARGVAVPGSRLRARGARRDAKRDRRGSRQGDHRAALRARARNLPGRRLESRLGFHLRARMGAFRGRSFPRAGRRRRVQGPLPEHRIGQPDGVLAGRDARSPDRLRTRDLRDPASGGLDELADARRLGASVRGHIRRIARFPAPGRGNRYRDPPRERDLRRRCVHARRNQTRADRGLQRGGLRLAPRLPLLPGLHAQRTALRRARGRALPRLSRRAQGALPRHSVAGRRVRCSDEPRRRPLPPRGARPRGPQRTRAGGGARAHDGRDSRIGLRGRPGVRLDRRVGQAQLDGRRHRGSRPPLVQRDGSGGELRAAFDASGRTRQGPWRSVGVGRLDLDRGAGAQPGAAPHR